MRRRPPASSKQKRFVLSPPIASEGSATKRPRITRSYRQNSSSATSLSPYPSSSLDSELEDGGQTADIPVETVNNIPSKGKGRAEAPPPVPVTSRGPSSRAQPRISRIRNQKVVTVPVRSPHPENSPLGGQGGPSNSGYRAQTVIPNSDPQSGPESEPEPDEDEAVSILGGISGDQPPESDPFREPREPTEHVPSQPGSPVDTDTLPRSPRWHMTRNQIKEWVEEPASNADKLARRLIIVGKMGLVACPAEAHSWWLTKHLAASNTHDKLEATYKMPQGTRHRVTDEYTQAPKIGLYRQLKTLPSQYQGVNRNTIPDSDKMTYLFSGIDRRSQQETEPQICLHKEEELTRRASVRAPHVDIDSHVYITPDLEDVQGDIVYKPLPEHQHAISTHLHCWVDLLSCIPEADKIHRNKSKRVKLKDIPQIYFGHVQGMDAGKASIHMFFPNAYMDHTGSSGNKSAPYGLTEPENKVLFDECIAPVIREYCGPAFANGGVFTWDEVKAASKSLEETGGYGKFRVGVPVRKPDISSIWADIKRHIFELRNVHPWLQDPFFCINAKNMKQEFSTPRPGTIEDTLQQWEGKFANFLDLNKDASDQDIHGLTQQYTDIGFEYFADDDEHDIYTRHTPLARTCCQDNTMAFISGSVDEALFYRQEAESEAYDNCDGITPAYRPAVQHNTRGTRVKHYPVNQLRDSHAVTMEPSQQNEIRKYGLAYVQSYYTGKRMWQDGGSKVFSNDDILYCGYSEEAFDKAFSRPKEDWTKAWRLLYMTVNRFYTKLKAAKNTKALAPSWRFEIRVNVALRDRLKEQERLYLDLISRLGGEGQLDVHDGTGSGATPPTPLPRAMRDAFFLVKKENYLAFVEETVDKILSAMDYVASFHWGLSDVQTPVVTMYTVLFNYLQLFGGMVSPIHGDVLTRPYIDGRPGFGLDDSRAKRGFPFFSPGVFNWENLTLMDTSLQAAVDSRRIPYRRRRLGDTERGQLIGIILQKIEEGYDMGDGHIPPQTEEFFCELLTALLLSAYRIVVVEKIMGQTNTRPREEVRRAIEQDTTELSFSGVCNFVKKYGLAEKFYNARGNRSKVSLVTGADFFNCMWENSAINREFWLNLQFRQQYSRIKAQLSRPGPYKGMLDRFSVTLRYRFFQSQTVFPFPDASRGILACKDGGFRKLWFHQTDLWRENLWLYHGSHYNDVLQEVNSVERSFVDASTNEERLPRRLPAAIQGIASWEDAEQYCRANRIPCRQRQPI